MPGLNSVLHFCTTTGLKVSGLEMAKSYWILIHLALMVHWSRGDYEDPDNALNDWQDGTCPHPESIKPELTCLEVIKMMARCDKCLDSRQEQKQRAAKISTSPDEFVDRMRNAKCNGTQFNCGNTRSYVTEIFEGLASHFDEARYDDQSSDGARKARIYAYDGASVRQLFERQANAPHTIIYHMRHAGTNDHVWTVEQLPRGQGYRLYQSYHDGYSLLAWLSDSEDELDALFNEDHGDIMIWRDLQARIDGTLRVMSNNTATLTNTSSITNGSPMAPMLPYAAYVAAYNKDTAMRNFKRSWSQFGQGRILSKDVFMSRKPTSFLTKLADVIDYWYKHGLKDTSPMSQDIYDKWIELHASPDPIYYPGLPVGAMASIAMAGKTYRFDVKSVEVRDPKCMRNARMILGEGRSSVDETVVIGEQPAATVTVAVKPAVAPAANVVIVPEEVVARDGSCPRPDDFRDSLACLDVIRLTSICDKCLDVRQDQKRAAARVSNTADEFVRAMRGQTCNGTEYNCGNTRSYVTEILEGLAPQFEEMKYDDPHDREASARAGNNQYLAKEIRPLFEHYADTQQSIVYHMRHTGMHDHVWAVEQLPRGQGYRLYQSYHDGYSLRAWLTENEGDLDGLFDPDHGDLMLWRAVQKNAGDFVRMVSNGSASLSDTSAIKNDPKYKPALPYLTYVANFNKDQLMGHFKPAWQRFGGGRVISKQNFLGPQNDSFISNLITMVDYMDTHQMNSSDPYPKRVWDAWSSLHASPDPTYYPDMPNNYMSTYLPQIAIPYRFHVKVVPIVDAEQKCAKNARVIVGGE